MRSGAMKLIHIYLRVIELLGREARLAWMLAIANLAIASAMFLEPILFGRIVDTLANAQGRVDQLSWRPLLVPLTLFINWRYGILLIALCASFAALIALIVHKTEQMQSRVERVHTQVAERTTDTLGNIALVQSFARIEMEVSGMKKMSEEVLSAQFPALSWWALASVITRASTTLTMLSILVLGVWFYVNGRTTVGEIVMFMSFAGLLITRLEHVVNFSNSMVMDAPKLQEFFDVLDTEAAVRDRSGAIDPGRLRGLVEFCDVSFSYDGKRAAV